MSPWLYFLAKEIGSLTPKLSFELTIHMFIIDSYYTIRFAFANFLHLLRLIQTFSKISGNLEQRGISQTIEQPVLFSYMLL